ncbi:MAG TPA: hypothetical protein VHL98_17260 [Microvirga sp.]|jgi:hypothetical protein|nr:hypothetical protein [Microvirga sp.]
MKPLAIAGFAAGLLALGCTERGGGLALQYNYNALTCAQLQDEAALVSLDAEAALGRPARRAIRPSPDAFVDVPWPDPSAAGGPGGLHLKARMDALAQAARGKSCAIRFQAGTAAR